VDVIGDVGVGDFKHMRRRHGSVDRSHVENPPQAQAREAPGETAVRKPIGTVDAAPEVATGCPGPRTF
jgi:hypothetical protein